MKMQTVKTACFSPTGTTRSIVEAIANGGWPDLAEQTSLVDITSPSAREQVFRACGSDVLVIGVPVYMGRVPALLQPWLAAMELDGTPVVCVVVYGNRVFDDALLELKNCVEKKGGIVVGCAAYIGEHSFSDAEHPVAQGRPGKADLEHARAFGKDVRRTLDSAAAATELGDVQIPGNLPYGGITELWDVDFIEVSEECVQCGRCAEVCPVGAVDAQDSRRINVKSCITCCACIKQCPQNARTMKPGPVMDAQARLSTLFAEPKLPQCFIASA